jgi:chromosome segregation ATPase
VKRIALCLAAALLAATPLLAQEPEIRRVKTSPDGKSGVVLIEDDAEEVEKLKAEVEALRKRVREMETELEKVEKDEGVSEDLRERVKKALEKARNSGEAQEKVEEALEKVEDWAPRIRIKRVDDMLPGALPEDFEKRMQEIEKRMEEFRKRHMEDMDKAFERMRKQMEELENDPEAEVEEWEETSKDGSSTVKIKIVRKSSKSEGTTPETEPAKPKSEERKQ